MYLTDYNFSSMIEDNNDTLVVFYDSKCKSCANILPLATQISNISAVPVASVDCAVDKDTLCLEYNISHFPTVLMLSLISNESSDLTASIYPSADYSLPALLKWPPMRRAELLSPVLEDFLLSNVLIR